MLLFLNFLLALIYVLLELVQKLGELNLEVFIFFGQCNLLVVEFLLFILDKFNSLLNVVVDLKLLIQSSIFILLKGFLLLNYLVRDQNRGNLTLGHLLNLEEVCQLVRVCSGSLILLVRTFPTFLAEAATLSPQWHLRILEHFETILIHLHLALFIVVHKRHVVQNCIHVKIERYLALLLGFLIIHLNISGRFLIAQIDSWCLESTIKLQSRWWRRYSCIHNLCPNNKWELDGNIPRKFLKLLFKLMNCLYLLILFLSQLIIFNSNLCKICLICVGGVVKFILEVLSTLFFENSCLLFNFHFNS